MYEVNCPNCGHHIANITQRIGRPQRPELNAAMAKEGRLSEFLLSLDVEEGEKVLAKDVYESYVLWCRAQNIRAFTATRFGRALGPLGVERVKSNGSRYYILPEKASEPAPRPEAEIRAE